MGPPRHLSLLPALNAQRIAWPVPFADGLEILAGFKDRKVVVLASGDPFWFGSGSSIARRFRPDEWVALPGISTFALAANRMGWALQDTACFGLHAAPMSRMRSALADGQNMLVLLRDGAAVHSLTQYLRDAGFGTSTITALEALGGPRERICRFEAKDLDDSQSFEHPVCAAIAVTGAGPALPLASGRPNTWFDNDGQITKPPVRAMTLSALAPRPFDHLWDIGGGSGSIGIEWLLTHPSLRATSIEPRPDRVERIRQNALCLGVDRLEVITGTAPQALAGLDPPDAVFVGGGLSPELLDWLTQELPRNTRLVVNAVTLETEALLTSAQAVHGGDLMRVELAMAGPLGSKRGWKSAFPIVQWSLTL